MQSLEKTQEVALVTGGSGFIGSEVIRQLVNKGIRVRALLRKTSPRHNLEGVEFETAIGDLSDLDSLRKAASGVDYVFHLAGSISAANREDFFRHNSAGTGNLARACAEQNKTLKRFVYVSSLAASGPANSLEPKLESETDAPISWYGESKFGGEKELDRWATEGGYAYTVLRPPAVYGPRDKGILEFVKMVNSGIILVFPSKNPEKNKFISAIHVEDLVSAIALAGTSKAQGAKEVFFISGDGIFKMQEVMETISRVLGKKCVRIRVPAFALVSLAAVYGLAGRVLNKQFPLTHDKLKELLADHWICSNERAKKILGFQPKWDLENGLRHTVNWYKENKWV